MLAICTMGDRGLNLMKGLFLGVLVTRGGSCGGFVGATIVHMDHVCFVVCPPWVGCHGSHSGLWIVSVISVCGFLHFLLPGYLCWGCCSVGSCGRGCLAVLFFFFFCGLEDGKDGDIVLDSMS